MAYRLTYETKEAIYGFFGRYGVFSNFASAEVEFEGLTYPSVENAFQASKFDPKLRGQFTRCHSGKAKRLGHKIKMRPEDEAEWNRGRQIKVMIILNVQKYQRHRDCAEVLLGTGTKYLEETNDWLDQFWGVCNGIGLNVLGYTLMGIRKRLQDHIDGTEISEAEMRSIYDEVIEHIRECRATGKTQCIDRADLL